MSDTFQEQPLPQQSEVEGWVSVQHGGHFPPILRMDRDAKLVIDTDEYKIFDIQHENELGNVLWTHVDVILHPHKHSYWLTHGVHMKYKVNEGEIMLMANDKGEVLHENDTVTIPANVRHSVFNTRDNKDANYTIETPAKLDLRAHLGVSMDQPQPKQEVVKKVPSHMPSTPLVGVDPMIPRAPFVPGAKTVP